MIQAIALLVSLFGIMLVNVGAIAALIHYLPIGANLSAWIVPLFHE